jgi:Ribonuclease G/E
MIVLTKGQASENIILTLNEKKTLDSPTYLLECTHVTTKQVISIELGEDLSTQQDRYNEFAVSTDIEFAEAPAGQWRYRALENISGVIVETGQMTLNKEIEFAFKGYTPAATYKGYEG